MPCQVATYVKSETQSAFGLFAWNWRFTLSSGQGVERSLTVVLAGLPRTTPCKPMSRINRATVHRATSLPSRFNCRQILRTP